MNDLLNTDWRAMSDDGIARQIGEFVKYYRIQQNKTQDVLAKEAGISRSTLSLLERGETVTVATLVQVLRVLDLLPVFDRFAVIRQPSPLLLAKAERTKRQRVALPRKKDNTKNENTDW